MDGKLSNGSNEVFESSESASAEGISGNDTQLDSFPPLLSQTPLVMSLYSVAYASIFILALVNNTIVLTVIRRNPRLRTITNYFLANLAVADLIVSFIVLPITLLSNLFNEWQFGWFLCKTVPYLQAVAVSASVNTLTAVAIERYCVIFYPAKVLICARTAFVIIGVIWLLPVCIQIPWILLYTFETKAVGHSICYLEYNEFYLPIVQGHFLGVVFLTCYLLPLCLITFFYAMVGVKVCRRDVSGIRGSKTERNIQASKIRIVRMLVTVAVVFALSWVPLYILRLRILFGPRLQGDLERLLVFNYIIPIAQWLGSANSCINPLIYCYFSKQFRSSIWAVLSCSVRWISPCCRTGASTGNEIHWPAQSHAGGGDDSMKLTANSTRLKTFETREKQFV